METKVVGHFGIHHDDDEVAWLMQGRGSTNALGIKRRPPFEVRLPSGQKHCNHQIPFSVPVPNDHQWNFFEELMDDPLVQAALPIPKKQSGVYFIEDHTNGELMWYLSMLSKLSAPIFPCVFPRWAVSEQSVMRELQQTNVQPYFVSELGSEDSGFVSKLAKAAMNHPRKLILAGDPHVVCPQAVTRVRPTITDASVYDVNDLECLHWEALGATLLKKYMKREPFHGASQHIGRRSREARTS